MTAVVTWSSETNWLMLLTTLVPWSNACNHTDLHSDSWGFLSLASLALRSFMNACYFCYLSSVWSTLTCLSMLYKVNHCTIVLKGLICINGFIYSFWLVDSLNMYNGFTHGSLLCSSPNYSAFLWIIGFVSTIHDKEALSSFVNNTLVSSYDSFLWNNIEEKMDSLLKLFFYSTLN